MFRVGHWSVEITDFRKSNDATFSFCIFISSSCVLTGYLLDPMLLTLCCIGSDIVLVCKGVKVKRAQFSATTEFKNRSMRIFLGGKKQEPNHVILMNFKNKKKVKRIRIM